MSINCVYCASLGVGPSNGGQWSDEVKAFFTDQVIDKTFIVYVNPELDTITASSASEDCRTILLVESWPNRTFTYVHSEFVAGCPGVERVHSEYVAGYEGVKKVHLEFVAGCRGVKTM